MLCNLKYTLDGLHELMASKGFVRTPKEIQPQEEEEEGEEEEDQSLLEEL